ncbi:MAG TPA: serine/threonine-protein kinase [Pirellulales bacterium]|nr:serine/threonine-protein kinase [Pirellulales bacterium]
MNRAATSCPPADELRQLLSGELSDERQQACAQHMDSCECCQVRIEELATEGTQLSRVVRHLHAAEPGATSAYWPALKALETDAPEKAALRAAPPAQELSLDFLAPPSDAAYLGKLAQFDVMRVLGRGGMGVVLEAFDSRLQRHVAIKVLDPELAGDALSQQRFCREARAAASITHENIVAVHQVEKSADDGPAYLVMQLVAGESLEQRLDRQQPLSLRDIVRIGMQASHGLAAAHAQGLIHRDIKPGNILLETPHDRVKLTDFGLARVSHDVKLTQSGFVSGTPLYMSPEQALGEETDPRSDLFSLGAVLYEMCTGQPPFSGSSPLAILRQIVDEKHRPLKEANPAIPDWLAHTVDRLLAKKPADRIPTAAQLAELFDFEWALLKTTSEDVPTVCQVAARKRTLRNRWIAAGVGATFLALGLLGGSLLGNRSASGVAAVSSAEPVAVFSANAGTVWSLAFDPTSSAVAMAVEDGSIRLWDQKTSNIKSTFEAHRGIIWATRFSHDGKLLATAGDDGLIKLWDPARSEPIKVFEHPNAVRGLALARDDQKLFAGDRQGGLRLWSVDSDKPLAEAKQPGAVYAVAISPDGQTLATAGSEKVVRLWNAETLLQRLPLEGHSGQVHALSFNHDGRRLASAGWDKMVRIWDAGNGQLIKSWPGHEGDIWAVAYSPDGSKLATSGHDGAVKVWNAETGELLAVYLGHKLAVHSIAFNPDGTLLASGGRDGAMRIWKIE